MIKRGKSIANTHPLQTKRNREFTAHFLSSFETNKCVERVDHRVWLNQLFNILSQYICNLTIAPMAVYVFCLMPAKIHLFGWFSDHPRATKGSFSCSRVFPLVNYVILALRRENPENEDDLSIFLRSPLRTLTAYNFTGAIARAAEHHE